MAFTVEDGSVVAGANSYASLADAATFHTDRANTAWTGADAVKQSALIRATDYIEQKYANRWKGSPTDVDQSLSWPRYAVADNVDSDEIPERLKQAVCILALEALSADLNPVLGRAVKREKVDVIEVEYMDSALPEKSRPAIDGLLAPLLNGSAYNRPIIRS